MYWNSQVIFIQRPKDETRIQETIVIKYVEKMALLVDLMRFYFQIKFLKDFATILLPTCVQCTVMPNELFLTYRAQIFIRVQSPALWT